jgi:chorismate-pyruvate lyase
MTTDQATLDALNMRLIPSQKPRPVLTNRDKSEHILEKRSTFSNALIPPLKQPSFSTNIQYPLHHPQNSTILYLLEHSGSFTRALEHHVQGEIHATIHGKHTRPLSARWQRKLGSSAKGLWQVRTTTLSGPLANEVSVPFIFAQTLIPRRRLYHYGLSLLNCNSRPIGNLIFDQHKCPQRHWLFIGKSSAHHLSPGLSDLIGKTDLWVRQSLLETHPKPIVITEIILPPLLRALTSNALNS